MDNYYVAFDENGTPYIGHSIGRSYESGKAPSYIEKIIQNGKARYFYTTDALKAYYDQSRKKSQLLKEKRQNRRTAKAMYKEQLRSAKKEQREANKEYNKKSRELNMEKIQNKVEHKISRILAKNRTFKAVSDYAIKQAQLTFEKHKLDTMKNISDSQRDYKVGAYKKNYEQASDNLKAAKSYSILDNVKKALEQKYYKKSIKDL